MSKAQHSLYKSLSLFILILTVATVYSLLWGPWQKWSASLDPSRTMAVSASSEIDAVPDVATLSFSVVSEGMDTEDIIDKNNTSMNEAIAMLKEHDIAEENIKTARYNLVPIYTQPSKGGEIFVPSIASYRVTHTIEAKIHAFDSISAILAQLPVLGINRINALSFGIEDEEGYFAEARQEAFEKAHRKAKSIASQNKVRLGRVVSVSEYSMPVFSDKSMYGVGGADGIMPPSIEPGTQELNVSVSVVYEIR